MNLLNDKADAGIVRTIIGLANTFDLQVAAEGAENLDTLKTLKDMGCHIAQGYHISQPLAPDAFVKFINETRIQRPVNAKCSRMPANIAAPNQLLFRNAWKHCCGLRRRIRYCS